MKSFSNCRFYFWKFISATWANPKIFLAFFAIPISIQFMFLTIVTTATRCHTIIEFESLISTIIRWRRWGWCCLFWKKWIFFTLTFCQEKSTIQLYMSKSQFWTQFFSNEMQKLARYSTYFSMTFSKCSQIRLNFW